MKEKEKDLLKYQEDNVKVSESTSGDKQTPMAGGGNANGSFTAEQVQKEASQPGGAENAAGKGNPELNAEGKLGSTPISDDELDTGEK